MTGGAPQGLAVNQFTSPATRTNSPAGERAGAHTSAHRSARGSAAGVPGREQSGDNGGPVAPGREEVVTQLTPLADGPHEIARVIDQLIHRGWLRTDAGQRLQLTDAGEAARARLRELATELRGVVHEGISDEEYVAALKVLRRMVANVEGVQSS
ncbi:MarR family transcriptional regulator [Streptomyces uncialis]|uniref:MarR family transcriptional regulator n=1 Tax=Streptomyces uncialis TaxID=1048205 RepID=UPI0037B01FC8